MQRSVNQDLLNLSFLPDNGRAIQKHIKANPFVAYSMVNLVLFISKDPVTYTFARLKIKRKAAARRFR